jgi:predicted O-linked N-acetylglucosamine transferase (SPINDLY family)
LGENVSSIANLHKEAKMRGIDPNRIVFAQPCELPEHLARHQVADLFLDTWPCNAHTTASDSLWAGLPVLTMPGQSFASRVAASLVTAIDLPDLIASSPQEYESMAIMLGQNTDSVREIKRRLHESISNSLLFDPQSFTRNLENLYVEIVRMNETLFAQ